MQKRPDTSDYRSIFLNDVPLLDTRSPLEFTKGAFPGACNLPLMSDDERHQVGICYKQSGQPFAFIPRPGRSLLLDAGKSYSGRARLQH